MQKTDRRNFLGASEISAVMGLSKWTTPLQLWAIKTGKLTPEEAGEAAEWGSRLEEVVAKKFSEKNNRKLMAYKKRFVHPSHDFISCELDRIIVGTDEIVEIKTCSAWVAREWDGDDVPLMYTLQVNMQLGLAGRKTGYFAVLIGGNKYIEKKVTFDQELYDKQINCATKFWYDFVLADVPPKAVAEDNEILSKLYGANKGSEVVFTGEQAEHIDNLLADRSGAIESINHAKEELEKIEAEIKQTLGVSEMAETERYIITWKEQKRSSVDSSKLKEDGLYEKYAKTSVSRVFRANEKREVLK